MAAFLLMLLDGPVQGAYETARAPIALRAVVKRGPFGRRDVLDLLEDTPEPDEDLHLYRRDPDARGGHVCTRGHGCYASLEYRWIGALDRDTGEVTEPSPADREWWDAQRQAALLAWAEGRDHQLRDQPRPLIPTQGALFS